MNSERWKKIDTLLPSLLTIPRDQQQAAVREACAGDDELEKELRSLLAASSETFLERPALDVAAQAYAEEAESEIVAYRRTSGTRIGPYRLIEMLGSGGMGEVWRAEQERPLRRTVALKLIKSGLDSKAVVTRFESERQALAIMDHPNIAMVFDASETADGTPYFVMEYVPGVAITEFCDRHQMPVRRRLELFLQVCDGVLHAHQKTVIHRDLKPSNVLVLELNGRALPKIIDFGLAKALERRLNHPTFFTEVGMLIGTPGYMSPEQASGNDHGIDTRTDVYSLGVILYELLVGALPFGSRELREDGIEAMLRKIREEEPLRPSAKLASLGQPATDSSAKRGEQPESLIRHMRGDLDWITLKAMEKDRERRYGSAAELAADIQRHLSDQPVHAGPPSAAYRAGKFIRRHRFGVSVAAAVLVCLVAVAATMTVQAHRIAIERDKANREAETEKRVVKFMTDMFSVSDPLQARGNSITAREMLDRAAKQIETGLQENPVVKANLMDVMGNVYTKLALYFQARPLLEQALQLRQTVLGTRDPATLTTQYHLAWLTYQQGNFPEAERLLRLNLKMRKETLGEEHPDTLKTMDGLACELDDSGKHTEAEPLGRRALEARKRVLGNSNVDTMDSMSNLAGILTNEGKYEEAAKLYAETIEATKHTLGPNATTTLWAEHNLAWNLHMQGRNSEAEKLNTELIEQDRSVYGHDHPYTLRASTNLAEIFRYERQYERAEELQRQTLALQKQKLGPDHQDVIESLYNLACLTSLQHRNEEAISLLRELLSHTTDSETIQQVEQEPDLQSLHGDPRFQELFAKSSLQVPDKQK